MSSDDFDPNWEHGHIEDPEQAMIKRRVRVLCADANIRDGFPVIALVTNSSGFDEVRAYRKNGKSEICPDLINAPAPKRKGIAEAWINVYEDDSSAYNTEWEATDGADLSRRIACLHVREEVEEGTGLDDSNLQNMQSAPEPEEPKTVKVDCWLNIDEDGDIELWLQRVQADEWKNRNRIACIHIERDVKVGEGLDD